MDKRFAYIVDDDAMIRRLFKAALDQAGYVTQCFADGASFVSALPTRQPGVVLLDLRMPALDGIDVLKLMQGKTKDFPVLIVSSHGDITTAVEAIRCGAMDFLEKPISIDDLLETTNEAARRGNAWQKQQLEKRDAQAKISALTEREFEVGKEMSRGLSNKEIARTLNLSPRTVEAHRARLMRRLEVSSVADVVRLFFIADLS